MSKLVLEVNQEQEKVLESLLLYMKIPFQKVSTDTDFWASLTPSAKERIEKGLTDAEAGDYTPAQDYLKQLLGQ